MWVINGLKDTLFMRNYVYRLFWDALNNPRSGGSIAGH